jgi:pentatricopeptide repeat protein
MACGERIIISGLIVMNGHVRGSRIDEAMNVLDQCMKDSGKKLKDVFTNI